MDKPTKRPGSMSDEERTLIARVDASLTTIASSATRNATLIDEVVMPALDDFKAGLSNIASDISTRGVARALIDERTAVALEGINERLDRGQAKLDDHQQRLQALEDERKKRETTELVQTKADAKRSGFIGSIAGAVAAVIVALIAALAGGSSK
jgi:hypothetical protein